MTDETERAYSPEAKWLAFTTFGRWNVTLREGATTADVDYLASLLKHAEETLGGMEDGRFSIPNAQVSQAPQAAPTPRNTAPAPQTPPRGAEGPSRANGNAARREENPRHINRLLIAGTKDAPVVEMYSSNKQLKFPVMKPPATLVVDVLSRAWGDGDHMKQFTDVGRELVVDWLVTWEESPKDPRWKDLVDIQARDWEQGS